MKSVAEVATAWAEVFSDGGATSLDELKQRGIRGKIGDASLRSLYWKIYLEFLPSLETNAWPLILQKERQGYEDLKKRFVFDPSRTAAKDLDVNNPLSLDVEGMHEILAPVLYVVDVDKVDVTTEGGDELQKAIFDQRFIEHDTAVLFYKIMRSAKPYYETEMESTAAPVRNARGGRDNQARALPIVIHCRKIQNDLLKVLDVELCEHLNKLGIEPQLYGLRWLRLLFGREFSLPEVLTLWDGLFADDPNLGLVDWVCVALLVFMRRDRSASTEPQIQRTTSMVEATSDPQAAKLALLESRVASQWREAQKLKERDKLLTKKVESSLSIMKELMNNLRTDGSLGSSRVTEFEGIIDELTAVAAELSNREKTTATWAPQATSAAGSDKNVVDSAKPRGVGSPAVPQATQGSIPQRSRAEADRAAAVALFNSSSSTSSAAPKTVPVLQVPDVDITATIQAATGSVRKIFADLSTAVTSNSTVSSYISPSAPSATSGSLPRSPVGVVSGATASMRDDYRDHAAIQRSSPGQRMFPPPPPVGTANKRSSTAVTDDPLGGSGLR
ncbi:TBC1 domain, member 5 [Phlyctochytrium bullatum]|nr:TBC1 domain, member 5 [Phlyctochytrium bullatum]